MESFKENKETLLAKAEEKRRQEIGEIASLLHENWRLTRFDERTKQYRPRVKPTTDETWIQTHDGKKEIDIANTSFDELPEDWKKENILAAEQALDLVKNALVLIHDRWLERNETDALAEQKLRYANLPKEDKEKDLSVLQKVLETFQGHLE